MKIVICGAGLVVSPVGFPPSAVAVLFRAGSARADVAFEPLRNAIFSFAWIDLNLNF